MKGKCILLTVAIAVAFSQGVCAQKHYEYALEPQYQSASAFSEEGLASVTDADGNKGVIDMTGKPVFGFDGTEYVIRKNGLIMALGENEMAAFFDKNGGQVTDYIYDVYKVTRYKYHPKSYAYYYLTDRYDGSGESDLVPFSRGGKFGYINSQGQEIVPPIYDYTFGFYHGVALLGGGTSASQYGTFVNGKYGYIDETGKVLKEPNLWSASSFYYNRYSEYADGAYHIIDTTGKEFTALPKEYRHAESNDHLIVGVSSIDKKRAVFTHTGEVVVEPDWQTKTLVGNAVIVEQKTLVGADGKVLYIAPEDIVIENPTSTDRMLDCPLATIRRTVADYTFEFGVINDCGETVLPCEYKEVALFGGKLIYAQKDNVNYLYNTKGQELCVLNGKPVEYYDEHQTDLLPVLDYDTMLVGYIRLPEQTAGMRAAKELYEKGLLRGVGQHTDGTPDFALDKCATRTEALVMLIRMLGQDKQAENYPKTHPFMDVAAWADGYVSYAYDNGLVKGVSDTLMDAERAVTEKEYLTYLLRVLGYEDTNGDFSVEDPYALTEKMGISNTSYRPFTRYEMVLATMQMMGVNVKNQSYTLAQFIIALQKL